MAGYTFFKQDTEDGVDYLFRSSDGRVYTAAFDSTIYQQFSESMPILLENGYGFIFSYRDFLDTGRPPEKARVSETIRDIIIDFLGQMPENTFVIYQCELYKQEKLFTKWGFDETPGFLIDGIILEVPDSNYENQQFIGVISKDINPLFMSAIIELVEFSLSLNGDNDNER